MVKQLALDVTPNLIHLVCFTIQFWVLNKNPFSGWSAKNCTSVLQSLQTKKIIGVWVADKSMV